MQKYIILSIGILFLSISSSYATKDSSKIDSDLSSFCKLYGYVKYFHPCKLSKEIDWNKFIVYGILKIIDDSDNSAIDTKLTELFQGFSPFIRLDGSKIIYTDGDYVHWEYHGLDSDGDNLSFENRLNDIQLSHGKVLGYEQYPIERFLNTINLSNGKEIIISTILPKEYLNKEYSECGKELIGKLSDFNFQDLLNTKIEILANLIIIWNSINYFHPYKEDFAEAFSESDLINKIKIVNNLKEDEVNNHTLLKLFNGINDGHFDISSMYVMQNRMRLPFRILLKDNRFFAIDNYEDIGVGDEITSIDGKTPIEEFKSIQKIFSGSPQYKAKKALLYLGAGPSNEKAKLIIKSNGAIKEILVRRRGILEQSPNHKTNYDIKKNIAYFDLTSPTSNYELFQKNIAQLENATAVLFDLRGEVSRDNYKTLQHLIHKEVFTPVAYRPIIMFPNTITKWDTLETLKIDPSNPKLNGKIYFLTNGLAFSQSESILMMVKYYSLGKIIGSQTAGCNGNYTYEYLITGKLRFTGCKVYNYDGSIFNLIGVEPDIILDGEQDHSEFNVDPILSKAFKIVESEIDSNN